MSSKNNSVKIGKIGEKIAVNLLISAGYEIVACNERLGREEADVIVRKDDWLVIVEVKTRTSYQFMMPDEAVDERKQNAMIRFAYKYLEKYNLDVNLRFDIIAIVLLPGEEPFVRHIENAF